MVTRRDALLTLDVEAREFQVPGDDTVRRVPDNVELKLFTAQSEVTSERKGNAHRNGSLSDSTFANEK